MPKVSVISTIYNGAPYIDAAINSILNQDYSDYEYIIVDDGSTDNSVQLVEGYCKKHSNIKLIQAGRIGRVKALNLAVDSAQGDYIANLDIDDIAFSCRLKAQVEILDLNQSLGVVGGAFEVINKTTRKSFIRHPPVAHSKLINQLSYMIPFSHSVATFRKSAWQTVGGYKDESNEDLYLWFEMVKAGYQLGTTPEVLGIHYKHPESYWAKNYNLTKRHFELAKIQFKIIKELKLSPWCYFWPIIRLPFLFLPDFFRTVIKSFLAKDIS